MFLLAWLTIGAVSAARPALPEKGSPRDVDLLQGTWMVVEISSSADPDVDATKLALKFVIAYNQVNVTTSTGLGDRFTFKLNESGKPRTINLTGASGQFEGKTILGIYQLDGGSLRLCLPTEAIMNRPREFAARATPPVIVLRLKKQ